jgi:16S rRNA (cytidine1402-2'-O)-methyltransferase
VTTALALSGLPVDRFCFEGFLPRKSGERRRRLAELADEERTLVLFEAPHRTHATLTDLAAAFGADRPAAVCRELTKTYEEVRRAPLGELVTWAEPGVRGEVTLVVGGAVADEYGGTADLAALVADRVSRGESRKTAIAAVAAELGVPKKAVYAAVLDAKPS